MAHVHLSRCACLQLVTFETPWLLLQKPQYIYVHYGWVPHIPNCSFLSATILLTVQVDSSGKTSSIRHPIQYETSGQAKPLFTGFIYFLNINSFFFRTHNQAETQAAMFYNKAKRFLLRWKLNIVTDI